jgi:hypothetical protein
MPRRIISVTVSARNPLVSLHGAGLTADRSGILGQPVQSAALDILRPLRRICAAHCHVGKAI